MNDMAGGSRRQRDETVRAVCAIVRELAIELRPSLADRLRVGLDSRLDRDLGIDSLGRAELALRIEKELGAVLTGEALQRTDTVSDLVAAVLAASGEPVGFAVALQSALPEAELPTACGTLCEVLDWHTRRHPERIHVHLLHERAPAEPLSYSGLSRRAREIAAGLAKHGVEPGDRVVLMMPTSLTFLASFLGVLLAGGVAVPIYPPFRRDQLADHLLRQRRIVANAEPRLLLVTPELARASALLRGIIPELRVAVVDRAFGGDALPVSVPCQPDDLAMLQYTSGSTGDPKGVMLRHANLLANVRAMSEALRASSADVCVSWLPLYHDMGLIGAWLGSLWHAAPLVLMTPQHFLARPGDWLRALHEVRGTITAAPNFAYELCTRRAPDSLIDTLDLSCVRVFANGAEPVRASTIRRFLERFSRCGVRPEAIKPVYGLAENSVGLAFPPLDRPPRIERVDARLLRVHGEVRPAAEGVPGPEYVACGVPLPGHEIRIVDEAGRELPERRQGRIQFRGPSATCGYFRNEAATRALFYGDWLETGDLGWIAEGDLFVGGRIKDLIIRAGRNIHPQDIEAAAEEVSGVRRGCVVAVAVPAEEEVERLVLMVETREREEVRREWLRAAIAERVLAAVGEPVDEIVLLPPHALPKTSSGKLRRSAAAKLYLAGRLRPGRATLGRELMVLIRLAIGERFARLRVRLAALAFALRFWLAIGLLAPVGWLAGLLLPDGPVLRNALRRLARAGLALAGLRLRVMGAEHLPQPPFLLTVNHASYIDGLVCVAALPCAPAFLAKASLARHPLAGPFLRRVGTIFVERWRRSEASLDVDAVHRALASGRMPLIFPEGTFTRQAGLLPFHLGAFELAVALGLRVVPVAIRGTRSVLRSDQWFPFRADIEVEILQPQQPSGSGFEGARELRDRVRAALLAAVREPDLEAAVVIPE